MVATDTIVCAVCGAFRALARASVGVGRWRRERRIAKYLTRHLRQRSLIQIGRDFGGLDHTNVLLGFRSIQKAVSSEPVLDDDIYQLCDHIRQRTGS